MPNRCLFAAGLAFATLIASMLPLESLQVPRSTRQRLHMPGNYRIPARFKAVSLPAITTVEELLPAARNCLENWVGLPPGGRLRIVSDETVPSIVAEAFYRASAERKLDLLLEDVAPEGLESRRIEDLSPAPVEATLLLAFYPRQRAIRQPAAPSLSERFIRVVSVPELLASNWSRVPVPLMSEIARATLERVSTSGIARVSDPAGTEFSFSYTSEPFDEAAVRRQILSQFPPSFEVSLRLKNPAAAAGRIVTHSRWHGFFPLLDFRVARGRLASLQGGGSVGERLRGHLIRPQTRVRFAELQLGTSPQALRYAKGYRGSAFRWGHESGSQRAGVASFRFEASEPQARTEPSHFQVYFPTLRIGGRTLVEEGYLETLGSSAVVRLAASLGLSSLLTPQCGAESLPRLPDHVNPTIQPITSSELLKPGIDSMLNDWVRIGADESVLILSDASVPPLLMGGILEGLGTERRFDILDLPDRPAPPDAVGRLEAYRQGGLPEEAWERMAQADLVIALSHFPYQRLQREGRKFEDWLPTVGTRFVATAGLPEVFASPWGKFPPSLLRQVARYTIARTRLESQFSLRTGEGSRLDFEFQPRLSVPQILPQPGRFEYHFAPANYFFSVAPADQRGLNGSLITHQVEGLRVPRMILAIEGGKITQVTGGGEAGEWIRQRAQEGELRLKRVGSFVNPKAFPWAEAPYPGWTPAFWAASGGTFRSGIIHIEFAGAARFGIQLQLGSIQIGGRELISQGRPLVLEDPNLRSIASQGGQDPPPGPREPIAISWCIRPASQGSRRACLDFLYRKWYRVSMEDFREALGAGPPAGTLLSGGTT